MIKEMVDGFRYGDIQELEGRKVARKIDYKDGVDGLPLSNVIKLWLEDGIWVVVRLCENEPKIKYYKILWRR